MSPRTVVTRIAPSPTGSMHIGTARTALFNWLYARHHGGQFLLRIEDTDRERSTEAAVQVIVDGLTWLGLDPDAPPEFQHARADRHRAAVDEMLKTGKAYRCYMTAEETEARREVARKGGGALRSPWREQPPPEGDNRPFVVRFKGPTDGETVVNDLIKGPVTFRHRELDDLVLLRSDGAPTYNLAVVVDDHEMGITHVIRGDDHLTNTARQTLLYQALGYDLPAFGHVPMIHGEDGAKLSKRHGAQAVGEFAEMGYLPEAMRNYLARLGWGHGDDEIFSDADAIAWFDVVDVVRAPARLDWAKLGHINNHYIRAADIDRLAELVLAKAGAVSAEARERLTRTIPLVRDGAKTIPDLERLCAFALKDRPLVLEEKVANLLNEETKARLGRLADQLAATQDWAVEPLGEALRAFSTSEGVGMGKFGPALRGALSGDGQAPDLASALTALGREESLARVKEALGQTP